MNCELLDYFGQLCNPDTFVLGILVTYEFGILVLGQSGFA